MTNYVKVVRLNSYTLFVDGTYCYNTNGVYCPNEQIALTEEKIDAIYEFLKLEKRNVEQRHKKESEVAVHNLLIELNFKHKLN